MTAAVGQPGAGWASRLSGSGPRLCRWLAALALVLVADPAIAQMPGGAGGAGGRAMPAGAGDPGMTAMPAGAGGAGMDHRAMSGMLLPSPDLPAGSLSVRVVGESMSSPVVAAKVEARLDTAGGDGADAGRGTARTAITDAAGRARFEGLPTEVWLLVVAQVDGREITSAPIRLPAEGGVRMLLAASGAEPQAGSTVGAVSGLPPAHPPLSPSVGPATRDAGALSLALHVQLIPEEDGVRVLEVFRLQNAGPAAFDPGPAGLVLPLPVGAASPEAMDEAPPGMRVDPRRGVVLVAPLPPGPLSLPVAFALPARGASLELRQRASLAVSEILVITQAERGLEVDLAGVLSREQRGEAGRAFSLVRAQGVGPGQEMRLVLRGLPRPADSWHRYLAASLAGLLMLGAVVLATGGGGKGREQRRKAVEELRRRQERLFDQLVRLDQARLRRTAGSGSDPAPRLASAATSATDAERREALLSSLEQVSGELEATEEKAAAGW